MKGVIPKSEFQTFRKNDVSLWIDERYANICISSEKMHDTPQDIVKQALYESQCGF